MQEQSYAIDMRISVKMIDAVSVEARSTTDDAVHFVVFREQQLSQVRSVLACDSSDECFLQGKLSTDYTDYTDFKLKKEG